MFNPYNSSYVNFIRFFLLAIALFFSMDYPVNLEDIMTKLIEELLEELKNLNVKSWWVNTTVSALIRIGKVGELKCQMPNCIYKDKPFEPNAHPNHPLLLSIDHIQPRADGGDHDISNLRLAHYGCNIGDYYRGKKRSKKTKKKISESHKKKFASDPEYRKMRKEISQATAKKRGEANRKRWADPEYREKMKRIRSTPEYKKKRSANSKKMWERPEIRDKMEVVLRQNAQQQKTPEARAKQREAQLKR